MSNTRDAPRPPTRLIHMSMPDGFLEALDLAVRRRVTNRSEYVRQAILDRMESEGIRISDDGRVVTDDEPAQARTASNGYM